MSICFSSYYSPVVQAKGSISNRPTIPPTLSELIGQIVRCPHVRMDISSLHQRSCSIYVLTISYIRNDHMVTISAERERHAMRNKTL